MDRLWSETCWSNFKYFIILILSTYYILCINWIIECSTNIWPVQFILCVSKILDCRQTSVTSHSSEISKEVSCETSSILISHKFGYKPGFLYIIYSKTDLWWHIEFLARPPALFVNECPQAHVKICNQSQTDYIGIVYLKLILWRTLTWIFVVSVCFLGSRCVYL